MQLQTDVQCESSADSRALAVRRALGQAAHDLNNTVGAIANFAEFLAEDLDPGDPRRRDAEHIQALAQETIAYLRNMLAVAGRDFLHPERVGLAPFLQRFLEEAHAGTGATIALHVDEAATTAVVSIDPTRLGETLTALIENAVEASDAPHTIAIEVTRDAADDGCVALAVIDQGRGFPAELLDDPFAPLTRSASGHKRWSLAKAAGFVSQSGGAIRVESEEGAGARVILDLPLAFETSGAG